MPIMGGLEATKIIRDKSSAVADHDPVIIAMTANAMKGDKQICLDAGMDDYISKPVDNKIVKSMLDKWVSSSTVDSRTNVDIDEPIIDTNITHTVLPENNQQLSEANQQMSSEIAELCFDKAKFLNQLGDDHELAQLVANAFIDDIPKQIKILKTSITEQDQELSTRQAHSIKGASANVAASILQEMAASMEDMAKEADFKNLQKNLPSLQEEFDKLECELKEFIK